MNPVLEDILTAGTIQSPNGALPVRDHITREEGEFLHRLVTDLRPERSLEVGLACGISALYICDALPPESRHVAVDAYQRQIFENAGLRALEQAGHRDRVDFCEELSQFALPRLAQEVRVDFAFIDGMHTFDYALLDFFHIDAMLNVGGVVAFDDAAMPAVRRVIRYALTNRNYRVHSSLAEGAIGNARRAAQWAASLPGVKRVAKVDLSISDRALGLPRGSRCVALVKTGDDERAWNFHADF